MLNYNEKRNQSDVRREFVFPPSGGLSCWIYTPFQLNKMRTFTTTLLTDVSLFLSSIRVYWLPLGHLKVSKRLYLIRWRWERLLRQVSVAVDIDLLSKAPKAPKASKAPKAWHVALISLVIVHGVSYKLSSFYSNKIHMSCECVYTTVHLILCSTHSATPLARVHSERIEVFLEICIAR